MNGGPKVPLFIEQIPKVIMESNFGNHTTMLLQMWGMRMIYIFFAIFVAAESTFHLFDLPFISLPFIIFGTVLLY